MTILNEKIWNYLKNSFDKGKISHAYIFSGPSDTGKFNVLKKFVKLVNKKEMIISDQNIIIVEGEFKKEKNKTKKKEISVKQIRQAIKMASYFSEKNKKKFLIIKEADKFNDSVGNSLLKIIEEPKDDTIIILLCEREEMILRTIRSRCQRVFFNLMPTEKIERYLKDKFTQQPVEKIKEAALYSRGRYKLAERMLLEDKLLTQKKETFEIFKRIIKSDWLEAINTVGKMSEEKEELLEVIEEWIWSLAEFLRKSIKSQPNKNIEQQTLLMIKKLLIVKKRILNSNTSEKLQLENFFIQTI